MIPQELLRDSTESYLKSLISDVSGSLSCADFDSFAPFGELGIDSFHVLKVIRRLEADFGTLPKSLLFENFTINDLAGYFVDQYEPTLAAKFADRLQRGEFTVEVKGPVPVTAAVPVRTVPAAMKAEPIRVVEKDAYVHPELGPLVRGLFERYKVEACVSRGTRKIAPNLFIGSSRRGYFNYGRSRNIILVYGYTGPQEYLPELMEEMYRYCQAHEFQLNVLAGDELPSVGGKSFSATPFGAMQRIRNLREFTLDGGPMRRLRYQVSKFEKAGPCRTEEYRCGSNADTDKDIVRVIDQWCGARTMVNPLVREVKGEILAGTLASEHRLFLTYLDDVLQNVIMITGLSADERGYLMDLEFYPPDMPLGGLEFAIVQIIETLVAEGCDLLSLGGTYGCKLEPSPTADTEVDRVLDGLREQNIFNDAGNLQFKNKFRPENQSIFLCRLVGSSNPENVTDIIMMIADPEEMQTSDAENHDFPIAPASPAPEPVRAIDERPVSGALGIEGNDRARTLAEFGFNPLNIPHEHIELDLKTDSWAQLEMPAIEAQMRRLQGQLQQPVNVDDALKAVFPFTHFVLTASGQAAEHAFFKAWPKKGMVLQNLLFPSTIFHQFDNGFTPKELPHAELFRVDSQEAYKGEMAWDALQAAVAIDRDSIAFVCIEVSDNAAGGGPVSLQHLREVKALLAGHFIPLVLDVTRVVENAQFLIEHEQEHAGKSVWAVVREILSCADAVIGSLTKDFCVNRGGIIATNDAALFQKIQAVVQEDGGGIDLIDRKMIALSLQSRQQIETKVLRRMEGVRRIWQALHEHKVPVVQPAGGHCVLIDVKQIAEFRGFKEPAASFVAWLYGNTGIRAAAHSVGMQKRTAINDLVRLAIPAGLKSGEIDSIIESLVHLFSDKVNIPEVVMESTAASPLGTVYANYRLVQYHNAAGNRPQGWSLSQTSEPAVVRESEPVPIAAQPGSRRMTDIAVVGMAGRYPKARNLGELWKNLVNGKDCIEELPAGRYERRLQYGSSRKYRGGFVDDIDKFDSLFFNISPREAEWLDPQERLFLEVAWEAMEDAGYYPEILAQEDGSRNIGVYVGAVWAMYQMLGVEEKHAGNTLSPNSFLWSIANRVSYCLNLAGPSLTLDTACSSSLTALYLACEAIQAGECSAAIVGGVNLDLHQTKFDINHNGGALSPDGVCRTFGKGANGYVAGEGIGAILLKPLDEAIRKGDNIYGVIKSATVNHGGRTSGYTVPNPKAQADLIASALRKANVDARSVGYIEAHGTGTELGDPVEITGLSNAFKSYAVGSQTCAIGSIKSNIGHLEAAAGVVSVAKVLLQMRHRQLVPSLHSAELNEFIDFEHSPFYVVQKLEEWKAAEIDGAAVPLRAGISSFGAGGANAHVILESYEPLQQASEAPIEARPLIFPLSARNEEQLRVAAVRLAKFLEQAGPTLNDVAFTLQQGRKSFEHRAAIVATTPEELIEKLTIFAEGKRHQDVVAGHAKGGDSITRLLNRREKQEFVRLVSQGQDPHKIAGLWTEGLLADWQGFSSPVPGKRVSLPAYPFADKRHWAADPSPVRRALQPVGVHPLIDTNESTFQRQLFKKTFHDRDFFIYDHHVSDIPTLPGVAYLELARKAGELAAGRKVQKIRNILWVSPISVQNGVPKEVFIELKPSGDSVPFEVFSEGPAGKILHSQGKLLYETREEANAAPEYIDLEAVRSRCVKVTDGPRTYPLFKSFGLKLGPSFQVLQDVYKGDAETLGALKLPEFRKGDLESMVLQPSLMDGSLQAGVGAQLAGQMGEMFVPYSIGEVEILHPLQANCFSYITPVKGEESSRVLKSNAVVVDETGKVLVRIRESVGVPLRDVHEKPAQRADADGFTNLYYSYDWENAPLPAAAEPRSAQPLVWFAAGDTLRANADQVLVRPGSAFEDLGGHTYTVNPRNKDDFAQLFESLLAKGYALENVVFAWPLGHAGLPESIERGVYSFLFIAQALIKHKLEAKTQLLYLYSQSGDGVRPHDEAMGGFVNALRLEHPKMLCKTVEVRDREQIPDAVAAELSNRTQDANSLRYEDGQRSIRKLKAFPLEDLPDAAPALREQGVVLITGGAGGLGLIFAEFLARERKARLVLTGRSTLSAEGEAKLDELRQFGAEVVYLPADVSNEEEVRNLAGKCKARFGQINGIIHAAGVLRDSFLRNKTSAEMSAVLAPKVYGTLHLDELTKGEDLDFFVTFSSLAAVAGNAGQCDYSFANSFMDSFAAGRERLRADGARSGKTLSINWSIWADGGMKLDDQTELFFRKSLGIRPLSIATGTGAFVRGLASGRSQFAVLEGIQDKIETAWGLRKKTPPPAAATQAATAPAAAGAEANLAARLQNDLTQIVMNFLKLDAGDVSPDKILLDLGFDSIGLTTFANAVNDKFQLDITPVLFFDYASLGEIAKHLAAERKDELLRVYGASPTAASAATPQPAQQPVTEGYRDARIEIRKGWDPAALDRENAAAAASGGGLSKELRFINQPIAIVGMSGVMPQSDDLNEFWKNLKNSTDMITVIPPDRWRWEDFYGDPLKETNKSNSKWGGFMREVDKFDPLFFGISPREAHMMDPQQRIFLEHVWKAVEDSGQKVSDLAGTKTGVFVGVATTDYTSVLNEHGIALDGYTASGNSHSILANRVSFLLGLRGPSAPIDTACSSSLIALHRALESIHTGSSDMAIVGGVQVMLSPAAYISFGMAGMMSSDGKCKTFDKNANGYVRGEGCGAIFLKPLAAAEADGNHIYAVIKATAENHGGKVTTLTAPNSAAQAELLIEAYEKGQVDPSTVGYIECHGTGTPLGDPIEIQALTKAFSELYKRRNKVLAAPHCGLSSVKTNIGHLETAAGIAGILKVLLAIKHKQIPANLHLQEINPYIKLEGTPFYIADKLTPWEAARGENGSVLPRRAGVSSFGFGGANAHIVLEEYIPPARETVTQAPMPQLIVLSAKNEDRLNAYVRSMHAFLATETVELPDFAYTLQVGRDEMPERLALIVSHTEELKQKFEQILNGDTPEDCYRHNVARKKSQTADPPASGPAVETLIEQRELSKLAERWTSGAEIDWRPLYKPGVPRRLAVPTYPFARERYWVAGAEGIVAKERRDHAPAAARLHPLIHRNISTLKEQKFASRFTGAEFYLADHKVKKDSVLPGVAYIEMAAAAGELSGEQKVRFIRDLVWPAPLTVGDAGRDVEVSLSPGKTDIEFTVTSLGKEHSITHCRGKLVYAGTVSAPAALDIERIQERCSAETIAGTDLYAFLDTSELRLGKSFHVVQRVHAGQSECLAVLQLPDHLKNEADQFLLHPALLDGGVHTAIGLVKKRIPSMPWSVPYSVGELEIAGSLKDVQYAYAAWDGDAGKDENSVIRIDIQLLDRNGNVLVRMKDFAAKSLRPAAIQTNSALQAFQPVWSAVRPDASNTLPPERARILLLSSDGAHLDWVRKDYPNAQLQSESPLREARFDQLLWIAPEASDDRIIEQQEEGVLAVFRIVKSLLELGYANKKVQWTLIVSRAQRVRDDEPVRPAHAGIIGLVGSLAKEYPQWDLRLLDLESPASVPARECLSLPWDKQGNALVRRQDEWFQQGLELMTAPPQVSPAYRQNGVYVVIGGAGGIGEVWSRFMIENYQANIVWIGRRNYDDAIEAKLNSLTREGRAPLYISADATGLHSLERAYERILKTHRAIHGVVHSAIVLQDRSIARMDEAVFRASLSAKVDVSVNMDRVFGSQNLDFLLFFSSIISFFKTPGQSNYAAGCTFKDSFAHALQQRRSYPVKVMNWGYWGSVGVVADETHNKLMAQAGLGSIEPDEGMAALELLIGSAMGQVALIKTLASQAAAPKTMDVAAMKNMTAAHTPSSSIDMNEQRSSDYVRRHIVETMSEAIRIDAARIGSDTPFAEFGLDSVAGISFLRAINDALHIELEATSLFEYSTVDQLSSYVLKNWGGQIAAQLAPVESSAPKVSHANDQAGPAVAAPAVHRFLAGDRLAGAGAVNGFEPERDSRDMAVEPIAIIGMSGRFAQSESLDAFWQNLAEGKNLVSRVSRWSAADCVMPQSAGRPWCSHGSFVESIDRFDPAFFGISAEEAVYMDPQQRLFLEESWRALEDAGYAGKSVHEKHCGVYAGCGTSNYTDLFAEDPPPQAWWGNSQSVIPARIAYHLNLQGPAIAVDTACSSALVAIHLACQGLWSKETEMALAGGVYVEATPGFHQVANRAGMLSPDGKCYSFDARANGFVPGEAVGVVVLKRLRDALNDGDHIHAVIAGSGVNQDGRSNGLTAPNARAQERLERSVYDRFAINPETIQVVEAHATATPLGDSIEHLAISRAFREYTDKKQFCAIGSVKTNIGHAGNAAGIASILKVLLSLKHRQIPPSLHFEKNNPAIDLESGPFYVNTQLSEWRVEGNQKRRAAISSFGFSGTNAHLVIEEAPAIVRAAVELPGYLLVLSARTSEQLTQQARDLLALARRTPGLPMNDASFTLLAGRMHLIHRLSCVARNQEELVLLLEQWVETGAASQVYTSEVPEGRVREQAALKKFGNYCIRECRNATDAATYLENLAAVAELYVQGYSFDFDALFSGDARRIPLPAYPFADERYWVDDEGGVAPRVTAIAAGAPRYKNASYSPAVTGTDEGLLAWLENDLSQIAGEILAADDARIPLDKVLLDLGFDSLGLTKFAGAINETFQLNITPVLFFDHPSVGAIAKYLVEERESEVRRVHRDAPPATRTAAQRPPSPRPAPARTAILRSPGRRPARGRRVANEPIAIVGISGVMPQSDDVNSFWENLKASKDLITVIPKERWNWEDYFGDPFKEPNKSNSKWGGFINDVDKFDPLFFGISPREAQMMDPQQRIFLECVWKAIEDSGQKVSELSGTKTGVFVGAGSNDYLELLRDARIVMDGYSASGNTHSVLANRVSFLLNLHGPSAPVDTACSSSLVALHRAIESIHSGSSDMAIAGGVQVMLSPAPFVAFGVAGMLSGDGRCKTFDKRANGYVRGEGAGAMLLKPLPAAEADGNHIYAVIKATAENHGGRVTTMTAPNSAAQSALLIDAYEKAQIDPATVGYIECHGTGTSLGDPIEAQALSTAFSELYKRHNKAAAESRHCGLGSVKTNIGHLETAAGVAGVLKVLMAIKHKQIPANIHFDEINPYIDLKGTPFYVVDKLTPWEAARGEDGAPIPRRAGVSSFGFGGANAHVVLEEYVAVSGPLPVIDEPRLIVLSAKNEDRLGAYIRSMLSYLDKNEAALADVAYTLQVGRDEMPERLALVVSSNEELKRKFDEILNGSRPEGSYRGRVRNEKARSVTADDSGELESGIERKELSKLAELWVSGAKIDWHLLYDATVPRRISAPAYPFARERHWIPGGEKKLPVRQEQQAGSSPKAAPLQSLVPVWSPARIGKRIEVPQPARIVLLGGDQSHLDWVRTDYPNAQLHIGNGFGDVSFDQLLWIAPEETEGRIVEQQEEGVLAVFRIIKSLLNSGYAGRKLQWTFVTRLTQQVANDDPVQPAHAGIAGLIGSLAKEYPNWDLRLLDVDALASVTARESLSLPWDKQGNVLAHRRGEWFRQELEPVAASAHPRPVYRKNGVYVVIGGAGGIGEVWSRFMIENYQANIVWIGRRNYDDSIDAKIKSLTRDGRAPLYISADATGVDLLEQAYRQILKTHPAIHGVVHSAIVLRDQSIGRMDEAAFRAGYSAKADVSVNIDRVFGGQELDLMLFFSSIVSFFKSPGQSNYSAGCTFKDSFAQSLQRKRAYPVKIVNWGYWGGVGVAADEAHNKIMAQMGIGSIEPAEGMEALQAFAGSAVPQMTLIKTLGGEATAGLSLPDVIASFLTKKLPAQESAPMAAQQPPAERRAEEGAAGYIRRIIGETLSEALRLDVSTIPGDALLGEYGVDSIIGVNLVHTLNETLEIDLKPSELLDYSTVDSLTQYIAARWAEPIAAKMPCRRTVPQEVVVAGDALRAEERNAHEISAEPVAVISVSESASLAEPRLPIAQKPAQVPATIVEDILERVLWQDALTGDYEKVTF